jgi:PhzF family phenazine biosynthesis protein
MRRAWPVVWVDAFADRPFGGNGCAVVFDGGEWPAETCQALVRETSLSECAFVGPSASADWRVRIFLADRELPFAGHPLIAAAAALRDARMAGGGQLALETGAGTVALELLDDGRIAMTQPAPVWGEEVPGDLVAGVVGLSPGDIAATPQVVSTGLPVCVTLLHDRAALARARLDPSAFARFRAQFAAPDGTPAMEPFLFVLGGATAAGATFARLLLAPPNRPEDPFTGSATGAMAAWLWARGLIGAPRFVAEQGHGLGRPGSAEVEVLGPPQAISGVRLTARAHVLMRGELLL